MNTNGLAKMYGRLTPHERLPLIVAAAGRGDEKERGRLIGSAPAGCYQIPDYHGLADALQRLALFHVNELLDLTAQLWRAKALLDGAEGAAAESLYGAARMLAYGLTVHADAWKRLAAELKIDAEILLREIPGYDTVRQADPMARSMAFTPEEAAAWLRKAGDDTSRVLTVDEVVTSLRAFLDQRVSWWE
jgi:hypothetical protein